MGKQRKKERHQDKPSSRQRSCFTPNDDEQPSTFEGCSSDPHSPSLSLANDLQEDLEHEGEEESEQLNHPYSSIADSIPSKFLLYQQSVQSPKGDITYLKKFFLKYVDKRAPLHLQEDFCGTALLSAEWLRRDVLRTSIGVDLDLEALVWCVENNVDSSRITLFHGNVLQPLESRLINYTPHDLSNLTLKDKKDVEQNVPAEPSPGFSAPVNGSIMKRDWPLPARDIVCAFNYSCCCLHNRKELVTYFKHALNALSKKGGIFVMDSYGGTSSERGLKLQRKFPNFTYTWEQEEFDVIERKTRISLHYQLYKPQKKIRSAFSYSWRLWSLPEIRDCLEEAGFRSVHFWIKEMPDTEQNARIRGFGASRDDKYEEMSSFPQCDAWNAYVVAVA